MLGYGCAAAHAVVVGGVVLEAAARPRQPDRLLRLQRLQGQGQPGQLEPEFGKTPGLGRGLGARIGELGQQQRGDLAALHAAEDLGDAVGARDSACRSQSA